MAEPVKMAATHSPAVVRPATPDKIVKVRLAQVLSSVGNNRLPEAGKFSLGQVTFRPCLPDQAGNFVKNTHFVYIKNQLGRNFARAYGARKRFNGVYVKFKTSKHVSTFISQVGQASLASGRQLFILACPAGRHCFALCFHRWFWDLKNCSQWIHNFKFTPSPSSSREKSTNLRGMYDI